MTDANAAMSIKGRSWRKKQTDAAIVRAISGHVGNDHLARLIAARDIAPSELEAFLAPTLRALLPDPYVFQDMEKAARRLIAAITDRRRIGIWSDYDIDGATSAAILGRFLRMCGHVDFLVRIPDRIQEGYGPNSPGLLAMQADGCDVVLTLDTGIAAYEPLAAARDHGLDIVVIDHHMAKPELPEAVALVNPKRQDDTSGLDDLCAAGVTFMFVVAVLRLLRNDGYFDGLDGRPAAPPDIRGLLDLVALGTVGDVVPLRGLNRAFVTIGLRIMNKRLNPGIAALARAAGRDDQAVLTEADCGWRLGPRINAGGRIGASDLGARLLITDDADEAAAIADELEMLNRQRQEMSGETTQAALALMGDRAPGSDRSLALAVVEDAHEGIVGISAARLKDAVDAPAIVLSRGHDGNLKGSARSVAGFDIGEAIIAAQADGLLVKGGGHAMAGGLTLSPARQEAFEAFMNGRIRESRFWNEGVQTEIDLVMPLKEIDVSLVESFDMLRPMGTGNPEPIIMIPGLVISEIHIVKEVNLKLFFRDGSAQIVSLVWNACGTELENRIRSLSGGRVDVLGTLKLNTFRGNVTVELGFQDMRASAE